MTAPFENIILHLFHQPSLQSVSIDELERMTQQHPSFAAARFLLLRKMQETNDPGFAGQLHKTTLYFNNPLWLQFLLQPANNGGETIAAKNISITEIIETVFEDEPEVPGPDTTKEEEHKEEPQENTVTIAEEMAAAMDIDTPKEETPETIIPEETRTDAIATFITEPVTAIDIDAPKEEIVEPIIESAPETTIPAETYTATTVEAFMTEAEPAAAIYDDGTPPPTVVEAEQAAEPVFATVATEQSATDTTQVPVFTDQATTQVAGPVASGGTVTESLPAAEAEQPLKIIIETSPAKNDLLFEPYHTIDYFASQGIKLDKIDPNPQDKLGKQLKSFTEWLKSMRKLPQASVAKVLAENEETAVINAAAHSVVGKDVITEAMAEVLEKQGLHDKAADVYRKLSLLNPSKSAYFAARIEALKH